MYYGTGKAVPADLTARVATARQLRVEGPIGSVRHMPINRGGRMIANSRSMRAAACLSRWLTGDKRFA
jgi:hypothetical protein